MPLWLQILLGATSIVAPWVAGYFGTQRGMAAGMAVHDERIKTLQAEVKLLREAKHDHAQFITRHEVDIANLKHRIGEAD